MCADVRLDIAPWVPPTRTVLLKAAEEYGAVIGNRYLRDLVEHAAGTPGMPPTTALVGAVADHCLSLDEPILPALCALPGGGVHGGYTAWVHTTLGISSDESEAHAARERQRCYAHFGAGAPTANPAVVDIGGRLCAQAGIGADERRHQNALKQRQAELDARHRLIVGGQAEPGAWVTVSFNGDPDDTDVFELVLPADAKALGNTCSVDRPLGKALLGAHVGETRWYETESGHNLSVTILAVDSVDPTRAV
ncbi:GreA/GreB family elongation factor [Mycobacterium sp. OTB74]|uniref:GreA/GreB family elongation factor n=1 Tax=Mycobacterium sp. OTB74 TaxID=1853452 RepID=UPI0024767691|nr:GreA/GreB family elongation factor [Mycobacterium sp. OTB74]MDH6245200.1 transcription elongation GreA/GreB family factor [Mycobacterium sp. OTB74]